MKILAFGTSNNRESINRSLASYAAAYKNLFDWASRVDKAVFQDKPAVYLSASPGPGGAASVLAAAVASAPYFGAKVIASMSLPDFHNNFDAEAGVVTSTAAQEQLEQAMLMLSEAAHKQNVSERDAAQ
jgi:NAD(P)H-dependent FMN reductase